MKSKRVNYLDHAKGILIILMVITHVYQAGYFHDLVYNFHMAAFFVISGIQFRYSKTINLPMMQVIKSRMYTMMIPFFFFEAWGSVTYLIRYGFGQNIKGFIYNTLTLHLNNGVLWFLLTLFFSELIFIALIKISKDQRIIIAVSVFALMIGIVIPPINQPLDFAGKILRALFFLTLGYYTHRLFDRKSTVMPTVCAIVLSVLTMVNGCIGFSDASPRNLPLYLLGTLCGTYSVIHIGKLPWGEWLRHIGRNSLIIYATHNTYYMLFGNGLGISDFTKTPLLLGFLVLLLVAAAEIPTVYLLTRFLPFLVGKRRVSV